MSQKISETAIEAIAEKCWNKHQSNARNFLTIYKYILGVEQEIKEHVRKYKSKSVRLTIGVTLVKVGRLWEKG